MLARGRRNSAAAFPLCPRDRANWNGGRGVLAMATSSRAFIGGAASAAGLSLLPGTARAAIEREKTYGVIELSTSGMTVQVYRFDTETIASSDRLSGFERMAPQRTGEP